MVEGNIELQETYPQVITSTCFRLYVSPGLYVEFNLNKKH